MGDASGNNYALVLRRRADNPKINPHYSAIIEFHSIRSVRPIDIPMWHTRTRRPSETGYRQCYRVAPQLRCIRSAIAARSADDGSRSSPLAQNLRRIIAPLPFGQK